MRLLIVLLISAAALCGVYGFTRANPALVVSSGLSTTTPVANTTAASTTVPTTTKLAAKVPTKKKPTAKPATATTTTKQTPVATTTPVSTPTTTTPAERIELLVHTYINKERVANGLPELALNSTLAQLARAHSSDMQAKNYFEHDDKVGCSVSCRVDAAGYQWRSVGENIYMMSGYALSEKETAQKIVDGWMNSPGHRANILNGTFTEEGIGIAMVGESVYATEDFAKPR